jgi:N-acetyl-alpha-D-muramate 1-phosphate uridylyltransferase
MKINTALILGAGYGKRLNPLTHKIPKPLLKIKDQTLLEITIKFVQNLGIHKIKINTFYLREQIEEFIINKKFELDIEIIDDGREILDTGGGILNMINHSEEDNFLVLNSDTIWNNKYLDYIKQMEQFYFLNKIENILMIVSKNLSFDKGLKGDFNCIDNKLKKDSLNNYIFTGIQIINKKLFKNIKNKIFSISEIWDDLLKKDRLFGLESKIEFKHVSNLEIYKELLKN